MNADAMLRRSVPPRPSVPGLRGAARRRWLAVAMLATTGVGCGSDGPRIAGQATFPAVTVTSAATTGTGAISPISTGTESATVAPATTTPSAVPLTTVPVTTVPVTTVPSVTAPATTTPAPHHDPLALDLLAFVTVANEDETGYDRDLFGYPASQGGGCTTRTSVLRRDSWEPVQVDPFGCAVVAGRWYSPYDDQWFDDPAELDIDHMVPLKEAWDSGARNWSAAALKAFGNDLTDVRSLRAVSASSNRSKGDKDPSNWLPPNAADVCPYLGDWVAIKVRWGLSMDESEYARIRKLLTGQCNGWRVAPVEPPPVSLTS